MLAMMAQCRELHNVYCKFGWDQWMEDHPNNGQDMAQVYADHTESEAEAENRLSDDDEHDTSGVFPQSSSQY